MSVTQRDFNEDVQVSPAAAPTQYTSPTKIALSGPMKLDLSVYRGDSGRFRLTINQVGGVPVNITSAMWDADIRLKATDPTTITSFDIEIVNANTIDVVLSAAKSELLSGPCVYDVEMTLTGIVTTLIYGNVTVTQDVSRLDAEVNPL